MTPKPVVVASPESADGTRCVDIYRWPDGSFGFRECRRDPEDGHGWRPLGAGRDGFASQAAALRAARESAGWLL
ncbi:hypothetical protein [Roseisalinus antarcticus]|uniref:WGR domain-containing protein n=1 Tax=Roseisalinus antarcticus TaxID=254357 RepID=A0A1Y5SQW0_9RHOB|nr:hypothetical protein [Roseisalinus antarcticus]SLN46345.1 hypothetical protein ROA7023_01914 [Roseisalinus antarcticus]